MDVAAATKGCRLTHIGLARAVERDAPIEVQLDAQS
jgi:hypothetical protein